ncbi:hypothetical protein UW163_24120 (plasmid) [Ralstonia solanacearum]|nr:hypothetical protein UW163_24120 [Ralstonia solanacearum]
MHAMATLTKATATEIEPPVMLPAELQNMSVQSLRAELARTISLTAHAIARMAVIWRELERRGEDLSDVRTGLATFLPMVADGKLHPEAVVKFAGRTVLLRTLSGLPAEKQIRLVNGERITVVMPGGDEVQLPIEDIPTQRLPRVFHGGEIRSIHDQLVIEARSGLDPRGQRGVDLDGALFDAIATVLGSSGRGVDAARMVIVSGMTTKSAADYVGVSQTAVNHQLRRIREAHAVLEPFLRRRKLDAR